MAKAIPLIIGVAAIIATGGAAIPGVAVALGTTSAVLSGVAVGLSVLGTVAGVLLAPQQPKPKFEDGQQTVKQDIVARSRAYGICKLGGSYAYYNSTPEGDLKTINVHCDHEIDSVLEHMLNDKIVEIDPVDGGVTTDSYELLGTSYVFIKNMLGTTSQLALTIGSDWDVNHRGRGINYSYIQYSDGSAEDQQRIFPAGVPVYFQVSKCAKIYDPREPGQFFGNESTYTWSDNAVLVLLDFLTRTEPSTIGPIPVGFGFEGDLIDFDSFAAAADIADQDIPLRYVVGAEKRYRAWGSYDLTEKRAQVLEDLLINCAGRLIYGPDGRVGISVGAPDPIATVTITDAHIWSMKLKAGSEMMDRVNEVRATYISREQKWGRVEAGIQSDEAAILRNGLEPVPLSLRFAPSDGQSQRLARMTLRKANPSFSGTITGDLSLLDAWGERWINLVSSEIPGFNGLYEVTKPEIVRDADRVGVTLTITFYDNWFDWDYLTDEQEASIPGDLDDISTVVPIPVGVTVTVQSRAVNGGPPVAVGIITWTPPTDTKLTAQARYREATSGVWQELPINKQAVSVDTPPLKDNTNYEAEVRFFGPRNSFGDWSAPFPFTALADPVAPPVPTGLIAVVDDPNDAINLSAIAPNTWASAGLRFYRNTTNTPGTSTEITVTPVFSAPNATVTFIDHPGAGDWWYFATAENYSGIKSAKTAGVLAELPPNAPAITTPSGPLTTYDTVPVFSGTGQNGATVKLYANAVQVGTGTVSGTTWSFAPSTPLSVGVNNMTATQTIAGNESVASGMVPVTVSAIDADAWAYISAMTVKPPYARQTLINTLITGLKTDGVWTLLDVLYLLASHDAQAARLNAKVPATFPLTATGSPVFTTDHGYKGTGVGSSAGGYLASSFIPSTAGGGWTVNFAHIGVYVRQAATTVLALTSAEIGVAGAYIYTKDSTANNIRTSLNDGTVSNTAAGAPTGTGHFCTSRTVNTGYAKYHEGVAQAASGVVSTALPSSAVSILRANSASYSDAEVCAAHWGAGLTATQAGNLYARLHTYLQATGTVP